MPEEGGFKSLNLIMQELEISKPKARAAIEALKIQPAIYNKDKRVKLYSAEDIQRIKEWLIPHNREDQAVEHQRSRLSSDGEASSFSAYGQS